MIEMFRDQPSLATQILGGPLGIDLPEFAEARLSSADLTDVAPTEYRADAVITLHHRDSPVMAVVIEVQLRKDQRKRRSWPAYVGTLHARLECPVALLVMCPDQAVADWSAAPITVGPPGSMLTPVALGPRQVPVVTDLETARRMPEMTVLSALAHGTEPEPAAVFTALFTALDAIDQEHADMYTDLVLSRLPEAARELMEDLMATTGFRFQSDFARRNFAAGKAEGKAEGEARAVLAVLSARGVEVPDHVRAHITNCTDLDRLGTWIRLAATAEKIEDLGFDAA